jgi:hypothetical protein
VDGKRGPTCLLINRAPEIFPAFLCASPLAASPRSVPTPLADTEERRVPGDRRQTSSTGPATKCHGRHLGEGLASLDSALSIYAVPLSVPASALACA